MGVTEDNTDLGWGCALLGKLADLVDNLEDTIRDCRDFGLIALEVCVPAQEWSSTMLAQCGSMGWQRRICPFRWSEVFPLRRFDDFVGELVDDLEDNSAGEGQRPPGLFFGGIC